LPVLDVGGPVSLSSVLEPVAHLSRRQPGGSRQVTFVARRRVCIALVPVSKHAPRSILEAVRRLFAVPDRARQRKLAADSILADGAEGATASLFRLDVVSFQPHRLTTSSDRSISVAFLKEYRPTGWPKKVSHYQMIKKSY